ncbi:tRNA-splicing endonuclease subunit tsp-4 [Lecanosticta acicola]|uniref:tRNA-splicing endonuclease subunit Sen34 n=1 Tax=Lecanosticta acicola TaxID=111012 RepID=A0AAI9ED92_9PEZI|nr:tRNA-splicing endonuclease subunit tsp-4 [Lecanosticta acicola]
MASSSAPAVTEPVPIYKLAQRYLLYDVDVVTYLRREHNISGVLMGTLPQASQQNVFLGLPLELMPEEARVLVEKNAAYIVDDVPQHRESFLAGNLGAEEQRAYQAALRKQGQSAAAEQVRKTSERKKNALKKQGTENWNDIPDDMLSSMPRRVKKVKDEAKDETTATSSGSDDDMFASPANSFPAKSVRSRTPSDASNAGPEPYGVTPTTSYPPLQAPKPADGASIPAVPKSYPIYKHLHENGYFMAPGLRFGCQYMAYPGDPLRFHSHFLCNGMDWDQEFDLQDLVGGGRLGTGVKKGFLIGGQERKEPTPAGDDSNVRAFCIEWGSM